MCRDTHTLVRGVDGCPEFFELEVCGWRSRTWFLNTPAFVAQFVVPSCAPLPKLAAVVPAKADAFSVKVSARAMSSAFKVRFSRPLLMRIVGLAVALTERRS
jgi:hypothetical protein